MSSGGRINDPMRTLKSWTAAESDVTPLFFSVSSVRDVFTVEKSNPEIEPTERVVVVEWFGVSLSLALTMRHRTRRGRYSKVL